METNTVRRSSRLASQTPRSPQVNHNGQPYSPVRRVNFSRDSSPAGRLPLRMIGEDDGDVFNDAIEGMVRQRLFPGVPAKSHLSRLKESLSSQVSPHLSRVINRLPAAGQYTAKATRRVVRRPELSEEPLPTEVEAQVAKPLPLALKIPVFLLKAVVWLLVNSVVLTWFLVTLPVRMVNFTIQYGGWLRKIFWFASMLGISAVVLFWWNRQGQAKAIISELKQANQRLQSEYDGLLDQIHALNLSYHQLTRSQGNLEKQLKDHSPLIQMEHGKLKIDPLFTDHLNTLMSIERQKVESKLRKELKDEVEPVKQSIVALNKEVARLAEQKRETTKVESEVSRAKDVKAVKDEQVKMGQVKEEQAKMGQVQSEPSLFSSEPTYPLIERVVMGAPYTSQSYYPAFRWEIPYLLRWLGLKGPALVHPPSIILHSQLALGECWPMQGDHGVITIKLSRPFAPTSFSLQHSALSPDISSAPRQLEIYGMRRLAEEPRLLWKGQYDPLTANQMPVEQAMEVEYVQLRVLSNWGRAEYTCVYRFNVQ